MAKPPICPGSVGRVRRGLAGNAARIPEKHLQPYRQPPSQRPKSARNRNPAPARKPTRCKGRSQSRPPVAQPLPTISTRRRVPPRVSPNQPRRRRRLPAIAPSHHQPVCRNSLLPNAPKRTPKHRLHQHRSPLLPHRPRHTTSFRYTRRYRRRRGSTRDWTGRSASHCQRAGPGTKVHHPAKKIR